MTTAPKNPSPHQSVQWPNMRHLRLLEIAVGQGSLTRAARAVHISQPAASQAVAKLAQIFDAPLLERVGNACMATEEGMIVTRRARRALEHLHDPALLTKGRSNRGAGNVLERYASTTQLRALSGFALTGNFAATARLLGQTEASIQRACKDMERIIGQAVLEGGQRNRVLTKAGQAAAARASLALREVELAHAELRERAGVFDSRLVVGALPLARTRIVPRAVVRLMAKYPSAMIEILDGSYELLAQRLRFGTCDLIIGALREDPHERVLRERRLLTDALHVVARAGHPLAGRAISGPELAQFPWILPRKDAPARRVFEALAARYGVQCSGRGHVETGSLVVLRGILMESDALTLISPSQVQYETEQGLLVPLQIVLEGSHRNIGITELQGSLPSRLYADFVEFLAEAAAETGGALDSIAQG